MKKRICFAILLSVFFMGTLTLASSHAGIWIEGYVRNQAGVGIENATVEWRFLDGTRYVVTNASGYYGFLYNRNWCDYKKVIVSANGYLTRIYWVGDGTCCNCFGPCIPPETLANTCASYKVQNFVLLGQDTDNDGIDNADDNCPTVPNGPDLGTCSSGSNGPIRCDEHRDCGGCLAYCSMNQEDRDGDGYGDVCDSNPMVYDAQILNAPFFQLACDADPDFNDQFSDLCNPTAIEDSEVEESTKMMFLSTSSNRNFLEAGLNAIGLFLFLWCPSQGGCSYACLGQMVEDFMNGPDAFLGKWIYPDGKQPLTYECPESYFFVDFFFFIRDFIFDLFYGDNFPPEPEETPITE